MKANRKMTSVILMACAASCLAACGKNEEVMPEVPVMLIAPIEEPSYLIQDIKIDSIINFKSANQVTTAEVKAQIESYLKENIIYKHINEGIVENNSIANINYSGKINDLAFNGSVVENYLLDVENSDLYKNFVEQCIGHSVGETFDVTITYPDDYEGTYVNIENQEIPLAGATAVYNVKINYLAGEPYVSYDELDNSIVLELTNGRYDTLEKFYDATKEELKNKKNIELETKMWDTLVQNVKYVEGKDVTILGMIDEEYQAQLKYYAEMAEYYEVDYNTFIVENLGYKNKAEYEQEIKVKSQYIVHQNLIVDYIADKYDLVITDEAYLALGTRLAEEYGYQSLELFEQEYSYEEIMEFLQKEEVTNFLKEKNGYIQK